MIPLTRLKQILKTKVIGQNTQCDIVATALYKHMMKLYGTDFGIHFHGASSLLLIGPSGSGKTYLVKQATEIMNSNLIEINAKSICQEGWHGKSFLDIIEAELNSVFLNQSGKKITAGVIFIDEFDKLLSPNVSSAGEDVNYTLQASILKYIEGMKANLKYGNIDFNRFLFVFAGAFVGLELENKEAIGFNNSKDKDNNLIDALINFGMLPEIAGRIQEYCSLNKLTKDDYRNIIKTEDFILYKWTQLINRQYLRFEYDSEKLIDSVLNMDLGVRGLIQEAEKLVTEFICNNSDEIDLEKFSPLWAKGNDTDIYKGPSINYNVIKKYLGG